MSTPTAGPDDRSPQTDDERDFNERLASIERCIPHMADIGGIWPRDVEFLLSALRSARRDVAPIEELRDAWETYSEIATVTDGHTRACSYRYAVNSKAEPCNCGYARVERTIRLLIGNAPVSSPPIMEKNDRG